MSALAVYCMAEGAKVSGSDRSPSDRLAVLAAAGAEVYTGARTDIIERCDAVVYSSAVPPADTELSYAVRLGKTVYERQDFLAAVADRFACVAAVAGTHGKTTVTAMIMHILRSCKIPFVGHVGGEPLGMDNLTIYGGDADAVPRKLFVTEACEFRRHFLALKPSVAVVTNMECDHPDCYSDINEVHGVFAEFVKNCPVTVVSEQNRFICRNEHICIREYGKTRSADNGCGAAEERRTFPSACRCTYGVSSVLECADGQTAAVCCDLGRGTVRLSQLGAHMLNDALYAVAAAVELGADFYDACASTESFRGVKRRFEEIGRLDGARIIFDYAHHPTEIKCAESVAERYGRVLTVFQPHTYSRTKRYLGDFAATLGACGNLALMPTYAARESAPECAADAELAAAVKAENPECRVYCLKSHEETAELVRCEAHGYDVVLLLGAGDIYGLKDVLTADDRER